MISPTVLSDLQKLHGAFPDSIRWRLTPRGVETPQGIETWGGEPKTCRKFWRDFGPLVTIWSRTFAVPAELIVACALTESGGNPLAAREEPGFVSDEATPGRVSAGLMQCLISTAREVLRLDRPIDRQWLFDANNALRAGTAYIASQAGKTSLDPPRVACAYNAGGVYYQGGAENRWRMRQFPIGTGHHADRYVKWFNEAMAMFRADGTAPEVSFVKLLGGAT